MSKIEVNQISSQCGSTLTIGQSGDTVTLACGASQTGFGRTGTVNWDTTAKTASFTAVSGNGYFVNTTSGTITVTLPASPSAGDIVSIADYAGTSATNKITIARNGSNFEGGTADGQIITNRQSVTLIYVDATQGWVPTSENDSSFQQPLYVTATGGTVTCCGDYKIHTFTGPGTFCVSCGGNSLGSNSVDYLVVAGGGAGVPTSAGGAGGYRFSDGTVSGCYSAGPAPLGASALPVTAQGYPITVGAGGSAPSPQTDQTPNPGSNSVFSTTTSAGGGGKVAGGSGAGGVIGGGTGFAGNTPPVSPPQGNNGGNGTTFQPGLYGGGGGGAGAAGGNGGPGGAGAGGAGLASSITASPVTRGGGGGGAGWQNRAGGSGGSGGGGNGAPSPSINGTANTGGAGGAGGSTGCSSGCARQSGAGGSGIVIIRYKYQ